MKKQWFRLDNAALIFPAIIRRNWNNVFRLSVTLRDPVDPEALNRAAELLRPRFPTFFVRLRTGFFWYYFQEIDGNVKAVEDYAYPLTHFPLHELRRQCIRILYYRNRIAVEFFHSVTDGTGGLIFLENLTAAYLSLRCGIRIPAAQNIADLSAPPRREEVRDCFPLVDARGALGRGEENAWRLRGTPEDGPFRHILTGIVPTDRLLALSHEYHTTVTGFLAGVMAESVGRLQAQQGVPPRKARPVKITVPVSLRKTFGLETLRNFTLAVNVGYDPRLGDYSLQDICSLMHHQLAAETIPQRMAGRVAKNVSLQRSLLIRMIPLPLKRLCMRAVYFLSGERKGCLNISNLGKVQLPEAMAPFVERLDFIIGVQYSYPNNCSVISWNGRTCISMIRNIRESGLEQLFFSRLVELGLPVDLESNRRK